MKKLCQQQDFSIEANDISAVQLLSSAGKPFITGPNINIYNHRSLNVLARKGMTRWVLPVELGLDTLADLMSYRPDGVETEVFAFGRLPLAFSARCYTARSHNLPKDDCQFKCIEYPDGRMLKTREDQEFLVLNGIQTQSALTHEALGAIPQLRKLGVDVLRISPQSRHSFRVVEIFREVLNGSEGQSLLDELHSLLPLGACNGYLYQQAGMSEYRGGTHGSQQAV